MVQAKPQTEVSRPSGHTWILNAARSELLVAFVLVAIVGILVSPAFLTETNLRNILNQASVLGILACAQFLVVLIGGFDLSVAAIMALSSVIFARMVPYSVTLALVSALTAGAGLGLLSGISVVFGRVPPLIATLGVMGIARGLAFVVAEKSISVPAAILSPAKFSFWVLSGPVLFWFAVTALLALILAQTRFGRNLYAVGGNERSAKLAGIPIGSRKLAVYAMAGTLSGLAGLALVVRTSSGVPQIGDGWELDTIAAIVIGGARLFGGEGNIFKAMLGVIIYQMIANVMNMANLDPFYQDIVRAAVIVLVVSLSVIKTTSKAGAGHGK